MIASLRALLALTLLAGLYLLAALMALVWVAFAVLAVLVFADRQPGATHFNTVPMLTAAAMAVPVALVLREVGRISAPIGPAPDSARLREKDAPLLWRAVRELAARVGTDAPAEIRLTAEVNAGVTDSGALLGLRRGRRRLYLGVPLLAGLDPAELRAVLAHELGHYARHHSSFTEPAYRGVNALAEAAERIHASMLSNALVRLYGWPVALAVNLYAAVFRRLTLPVRRRQEIEADRVAAEVAGAAALSSALRAVPALTAAWNRFRTELAEPYRVAGGTIPDDRFHPFAAMLDDPDVREWLAVLRSEAAAVPAVPGDSHPALSVRLSRVSGLPTAGGDPVGMPTLSDVDGHGLRAVPGAGAGRRRPWRDWIGELAAWRAAGSAGPLRAATLEVAGDPAEPTLRTVLGLLDAGRGTELARSLAPESTVDDQARAGLVAAVVALVGRGLVGAGAAYWGMGWVGPPRLVAADADELPVWVAAAVEDPLQVSWLRLQLAALGVDPAGVPVAPPVAAGGARRTATIVVAADVDPVTGGRRRGVAYSSLGVLAVLLLAGGIGWAGRGEPEPFRPGVRMVVGPDGNLVPSPGGSYPVPTYRPVPLPTSLPTYVPLPLPTGLLPTGLLPPVHVPLAPRTTP